MYSTALLGLPVKNGPIYQVFHKHLLTNAENTSLNSFFIEVTKCFWLYLSNSKWLMWQL